MTTVADYRKFCEGRLAISLAGNIAMERATRGSGPGWRRLRSDKELTAFHEAGHAVVATATEFFVQRVYVVQSPEPRMPLGVCVSTFVPDYQPRSDVQTPVLRDTKIAGGLCWALGGDAPTWKSALAVYRAFRGKVRQMVDQHWLAIIDLAEEIERRGDLNRAEVAGILAHNGL